MRDAQSRLVLFCEAVKLLGCFLTSNYLSIPPARTSYATVEMIENVMSKTEVEQARRNL